jgi:hypothetical protein
MAGIVRRSVTVAQTLWPLVVWPDLPSENQLSPGFNYQEQRDARCNEEKKMV